ncbi:FAD-dependent oxidoreductase [Streptomyces sp. WMMC500]|uniref:NAD(P)/FAD-dependent oxidoreductase n=1 Tax=Streptomyces sp. WMMC500 TaxID=3015154 RepID=UPI00248BD965|nr:FAD-dependent oxidoreductase [Streptomyces sp. WMMC500]WBB63905.1 FAD-dependent oxidoreductase [Streptomyces sp. WMMC500]
MPTHPRGHRIVVVGAGYTGMFAAVRTAHRTRRLGARITLVNPSPRFTERLRMHQVAAGQRLADHRIADLLAGTGVEFVEGRAVAIDPRARRVTVERTARGGSGDGPAARRGVTDVPYDTLVYALGSVTDVTRVPGADTHAVTLDDPRAAHAFGVRLAALAAAGGRVTVSGGGLTGVEAAAELAESHPGLEVTLLSRGVPGAMMGDRARAHLDRALARLGVTVRAGADVTKVLPGAVELAGGEQVPSDLTLWTAGVRVSGLAARAGIETDARGLVVVDDRLRSVSHPEVYAIGDAAAVRQAWGQVHGTCQSGLPTAQHVADALARTLRGRAVKRFRFGYFHQPVSLGRRDAVIQFTYADDAPRRVYLRGRWAVRYKEAVSSSPVMMYRLGRRMNVRAVLSRGGRATRRAARRGSYDGTLRVAGGR